MANLTRRRTAKRPGEQSGAEPHPARDAGRAAQRHLREITLANGATSTVIKGQRHRPGADRGSDQLGANGSGVVAGKPRQGTTHAGIPPRRSRKRVAPRSDWVTPWALVWTRFLVAARRRSSKLPGYKEDAAKAIGYDTKYLVDQQTKNPLNATQLDAYNKLNATSGEWNPFIDGGTNLATR